MEFQYDPALKAYMEQHGKKTIVVEMVEINNSDLDVSELHVFFPNDRIRERFLARRYRSVPTEMGEVLLPPFPLTFDEVVTFRLKKFLCFHSIGYTGIKV